jgi:hypothetical protein
MEDSQQRKRPASDYPLSNEEGAKRNRPNPETAHHQQHSVEDTTAISEATSRSNDSSVEELLSVPLNVIFREVPSSSTQSATQQRRKPLLTRAEAQCLVKVSQLAHEVDVIVGVSSEVLSRQRWCRIFGKSIEGVPLLRSVLPVLAVHGHVIPKKALANVQAELERVLYELEACASALRQYSEQNWTLSESLMDAFGDSCDEAPGQELAKEKRCMAEIEEEVCTRIESLLGMLAAKEEDNAPQDAFDQAMDSDSGRFVSMQTFCYKLLGLAVDETVSAATAPASVENASIADENGGSESFLDKSHDLIKHSALDDDGDQWSCSTVSIRSPERRHSHMNAEEQSPDGSYKIPEMTEGTSAIVEALADLASGRRGGCGNHNRGLNRK